MNLIYLSANSSMSDSSCCLSSFETGFSVDVDAIVDALEVGYWTRTASVGRISEVAVGLV